MLRAVLFSTSAATDGASYSRLCKIEQCEGVFCPSLPGENYMDPSASCPICHSLDVGEYGNDGSAVLWCICYQCTSLWVRTLGTTDPHDVAGSPKGRGHGVESRSSREMTDIITKELDAALVAVKWAEH
jgi:hypothetical protein